MPLEFLTSPLASIPAAADPINVAGSGTGGVYGSWVELVASAPSDLYIAGIAVLSPGITTYADVDIGVGAAASEVVKATFGAYVRNVAGFGVDPRQGQILAGIPISGIASGNRIAARVKVGNTSTANFTVALLWLPNPITGTVEVTANPLLTTAGIVSFTTSGTPWANPASFTQILASTAAAWVVNHLVVQGNQAGAEIEIDLATGAAASETVVTTLRTRIGSTQSWPSTENLPILFDNIGNGVRVSTRVRSSIASTAMNIRVGYYEKPL